MNYDQACEELEHGRNEYAYVPGLGPVGSYEELCHVIGIDTPEQVEAEQRYYDLENWKVHMDRMEAIGGPVYDWTDRNELPW